MSDPRCLRGVCLFPCLCGVIGPQGMPDGDIPWGLQKVGQGIVPCLTIRATYLDIEHVLMVAPGLVQQEAVVVFTVPMQGGVHERPFMPHGVEKCIQQFEKTLALAVTDLEADEIGGVHGAYSFVPVIRAARVAASAG